MTYYDDIRRFHEKFDLPYHGDGSPPGLLEKDAQDFRSGFLQEELDEFKIACEDGNLHDAADALADLVVVALGTAHMMGLPFEEIWAEVQRANMTKVRATHLDQSKRKSVLDIVKPPGFKKPDHNQVLDTAAKMYAGSKKDRSGVI